MRRRQNLPEVYLGLMILVFCSTTDAWTSDSTPLAFKSCATASSIQRCKVKYVEIAGCDRKSSSGEYNNYSHSNGNNIEDLTKDRNFCKISKKSQLNFTITVDTGFSSGKLTSQFTGAGGPGVDCTPQMSYVCPPWRTGCPPARVQLDPSPCLFTEFPRDACRSTHCPLNPRGLHKVNDYIKINPASDVTNTMRNVKVQWKMWNTSNKKENCCMTFWLKY